MKLFSTSLKKSSSLEGCDLAKLVALTEQMADNTLPGWSEALPTITPPAPTVAESDVRDWTALADSFSEFCSTLQKNDTLAAIEQMKIIAEILNRHGQNVVVPELSDVSQENPQENKVENPASIEVVKEPTFSEEAPMLQLSSDSLLSADDLPETNC